MWTLLLAVGCDASPGGWTSYPPYQVAPETPPASGIAARTVDSEALKAALDGGKVPVLFDVRTPEEYAKGHVPGAKNLPLQQLDERMADVAPYKAGEVWLICEAGGRSAKAATQLSAAGYSTVNVSDGTSGWRAHSYPTE